MSGILARLESVAEQLPSTAIALADGDCSCSYAQLLQRVLALSTELESLACDVVALHGENSINWVIADLACQQAGIACVPLPTFFSATQLANCVGSAGVQLLLSDPLHKDDTFPGLRLTGAVPISTLPGLHCRRIIAPAAVELPAGTQKITFTSGSTGAPKGVCLSLEHQWRVAQALAQVIGQEAPRHLCLLPLSTLLENIAGAMTPLLLGGSVTLLDDRMRGFQGSSSLDVERLLACIDAVRPTTLILIPQLLSVLLAAVQGGWRPPACLSFIAVGGGRVAAQTLAAAQDAGLPVYQGYGLSECASVVALNTPRAQQLCAVGRPLPHAAVAIENGEIVVSGACFLGYLGEPGSWYPDKVYTGDIGRLDGGWLSVEGRRKNVLITSFGRNVSPEWIEAAMLSRPLLSNCVIMGDGEAFLSALLSAPAAVLESDIEDWVEEVNATLPDYARIARWTRIGETEFRALHTENGRPQRALINQRIAAGLANYPVSAEPRQFQSPREVHT